MQSNSSAGFSSGFSSEKSPSLEAEFQQLIAPRVQQQKSSHLTAWLQRGLKALVYFLTGQQTLRIRTRVLKDGSRQWIAFDPVKDTRHIFNSQQAVLTWVEQRYYQ